MRSEKGRNTYSVVPERVADARRAIAALVADLPGDAGPPPDVALEAFAAASPERVFAIAATVAGQAQWLGQAEADAAPGGRFHVDLGGDAAAGTYAVVEAPSRLAFGWGQEGNAAMAPDSSRVDLRFTPSGDGTLIRLEHRGLPEVMHAPHLASWAHHLPRLADAASAG
jgi:glutathione S-transferase